MKESAEDNFNLHENGRMFTKSVENTGEKGKLLIMSNFSFSHSVLKRPVMQTHKNHGLFRKGLKWYLCQIKEAKNGGNGGNFIDTIKTLREKEKLLVTSKGEIACNKQRRNCL